MLLSVTIDHDNDIYTYIILYICTLKHNTIAVADKSVYEVRYLLLYIYNYILRHNLQEGDT